MSRYQNIDEQLAHLNVEDEENEDLIFEGDVEEEVNKYELCLVGRFLTEKNINTRAMKTKIADVWKPTMGINIKELETGIYLFQFFHKEDKQWVINGGPWNFDNAMLLLEEIPIGEEPLKVPLWFLKIWIQIHDLPNSFMTEAVGQQLGNFFGSFVQYDPKNNSSIWRECMRIKIMLDVRKPLKRRKKIKRKNGSEFVVSCKYERLGDFCFACGLVTHTERFCRRSIDLRSEEGTREWGSWLRAPARRGAGQGGSKWLRSEDDAGWAERIGRENNLPQFSGVKLGNQDMVSTERSSSRSNGRESSKKIVLAANQAIIDNRLGPANYMQLADGLEAQENDGLDIEDRKRRRSGLESNTVMDVEGAFSKSDNEGRLRLQQDTVFSDVDYTVTSNNSLATLAVQASHPL